MAYLTYDEYVQLGGQMSESDFVLAEFKARSRIDYMTLGRVKNMSVVPEEVKMAIMVIMKVDAKYSAEAQADSAIVSSFSTDGYSESYGGASEQSRAVEAQTNGEVKKMLFGVVDANGVPLIYRGLPSEYVQTKPATVHSSEYDALQEQMNDLRSEIESDVNNLRGDVEQNYLRVGR